VGSTVALDLYLGNEDSNNWVGWFDGANAQVSNGVQKAAGSVLEGLVDAVAVWGTAPPSVRLAFAAYASPDGGAMTLQAPCGDGDGDFEMAEWVSLTPLTSDAVPVRSSGLLLRAASPQRRGIRATIETARPARIVADLLDVRGRRVRRLFDGDAANPVQVASDALPSGVYVLRVRGPFGTTSRRVIVLD
jgi:hypothetical protein